MKITEKKYYPWLLVFCYSIMGIFFPAAVTQYSMIVDDLTGAMHVSGSIILMADTCRAICLFSAMFLTGYIYKHLGLRKTMALGISCQVIPQFVIPIAINFHNLPMLFVFKAMQGLNAIAFPLYISTITLWMDERYDAIATAIFNGSFTAGSGVGAFITSRIIPAVGWKSSFYAIGCLCLITCIPVLLITRDKPVTNAKVTSHNNQKGIYRNIVRQPITWLLIFALLANTWVSQAVTVDMSVYVNSIYDKSQTGNLMLVLSVITVIASILAGVVSDSLAMKSKDKLKNRSIVMLSGYFLSMIAAILLPITAVKNYYVFEIVACVMAFGASWPGGVFWSLPVLAYSKEDNVAGTAFCSAASNVPNPIAPMVVGVLLGSHGYWTIAWNTCAAASMVSIISGMMIAYKSKQ